MLNTGLYDVVLKCFHYIHRKKKDVNAEKKDINAEIYGELTTDDLYCMKCF